MDLFGLDRLYRQNQEWRKKQEEIKQEVFDVIIKSNETFYKLLGKENTKEYWDWRLKMDKLRYNIN